jgi:hypothetical protein
MALACAVAAVVLALSAAARRQRMPTPPEWSALLILIVPQWCVVSFGPSATSFAPLHIGWGTALLLSLAAPLWLALLGGTGIHAAELPRPIIAAAIIGIGAVFLVLPVDATAVTLNQIPALLLNVLLGIAIVGSWVLARPRLSQCPVRSAAAAYLAMSVLGYVGFACIYERASWQQVGLHVPLVPLLAQATVLAVSWSLWFWLLQNSSLGAFSIRMLANCAATLLPGFAFFGFGHWRTDAAFVISCIAVAVALRATPAKEQPVSLGLARS